MWKIKTLSREEAQALTRPYLEKWQAIFSQPLERNRARATVISLYRRLGYPPPQVVFLPSPFAIGLVTLALFDDAALSEQSLHNEFLALRDRDQQNLFEALFWQICGSDPSQKSGNDWFFVDCLAGQLSDDLYRLYEEESGYRDPFYSRPLTSLEITEGYLLGEQPRSHRNLGDRSLWHFPPPQDEAQLYDQRKRRDLSESLYHQLRVEVSLSSVFSQGRAPQPQALWYPQISRVAAYDFAYSIGFLPDLEVFGSVLDVALGLGFVSPFRKICLVCDRPQFRHDPDGALHSIGEPAIYFSDGYGHYAAYHGRQLPHKYSNLPVSQWRAKWVLEEGNAEIRRILIQEIGYARLCRELQAEVLDTWREYTLLKLPIWDDFSGSVARRYEPKSFSEGTEATYLLKMTCPSTQDIYALRVPPTCARPARLPPGLTGAPTPTGLPSKPRHNGATQRHSHLIDDGRTGLVVAHCPLAGYTRHKRPARKPMASKTDLQDILKDQYGINKNITQSLSQDECDQLLELLSNTPSVDRLVAAFVQKNNELSVNNRTFGQQRSNAQKRLERLMKEHQQLEDIIAKQEEKIKS